jgi:NAD(P)-dependent dehydrogenase (short-subunit alcohol dehydrogenase family)
MINEKFDIKGKVALLTGAGGVLGRAMSRYLAEQGAKVVVTDRSKTLAEGSAEVIRADGNAALGLELDALSRASVERALYEAEKELGGIDILVNAAGGNSPKATASAEMSFFDIPEEAMRFVVDLNLMGSVIPSQVIGRHMVERDSGVIINISSMNSFRPLTRIVGYSAAKAAINNFTQWLAVHLAQEYSPNIRVNAIAPGFFETAQNKFLLREESGELTARGQQIIDHTPAGRFGDPDDLLGTLHWLASDAARFVSGIVVPVDGGFSAFSGV